MTARVQNQRFISVSYVLLAMLFVMGYLGNYVPALVKEVLFNNEVFVCGYFIVARKFSTTIIVQK